MNATSMYLTQQVHNSSHMLQLKSKITPQNTCFYLSSILTNGTKQDFHHFVPKNCRTVTSCFSAADVALVL